MAVFGVVRSATALAERRRRPNSLARLMPSRDTDVEIALTADSKDALSRLDHFGGDCVLVPLAIEHHPALCLCLAVITLADARLHRQVALVSIPIDRLALYRGVGRDIEQNRQRRRRQELLHVGEPRRIESER